MYMCPFLLICSIETVIDLSSSSSTQETQIVIIELLTRYIVKWYIVILLHDNSSNVVA